MGIIEKSQIDTIAFDYVDHNKLWQILKEMTTLPAS